MKKLEVLFTPAEFEALQSRDLSQATCVVFDVLRATSTIVTALANGAASVQAVPSIPAALELKKKNPNLLLAGERDGFRITSKLTGSIDFDFGNSPREFTPKQVQDRELVITTTNGSRAIHACAKAKRVWIASFLNLTSVAQRLSTAEEVLIICSGTHEEASYEDTLGAGALCELIWPQFTDGHLADSACIARNINQQAGDDLLAAMQFARNGRRLLGIPELREDVALCLKRDVYSICPTLNADGKITLRSRPNS